MILYSQINQIATDAVMHRHKLTDQAAKDTNANTRHLDLRTDISQFKVSKHFFFVGSGASVCDLSSRIFTSKRQRPV